MATPIDPTQREDYLRLFRSYYKKYLGRDVNEDEISGNLATVEQANAALNGITNSIEYRALASEHPDWFNNDGTLKSGYTNQGAGGGSSTTGGSAPSFTAGMTRDQVKAAVEQYYASRGVQPNPTSVDYWTQKYFSPEFAGDINYFQKRLATADEFGGGGGGINLNAPLNQQYGGTMPEAPTAPAMPTIPQAPAFQAPTWQSVYEDPGYQFAIQQGTEAAQNAQAAKGMLHSGATLKALSDLGQNTANQFYGNAYNRALNTYNTNYQTQYRDPYTAQVSAWQLGNDAAQQRYQNQWSQYLQGYNQYRNWQNDVWNRQYGYATA
jgi:hypothetical protein